MRTAIVLAGERPGGNALARAYEVTSSLTLDLAGRPVMDWTLQALAHSKLGRLVLVGPGEAALQHPAVIGWLDQDNVTRLPPAAGPAASALAGAAYADEWPVLLTAADHALLRADLIDAFCAQAGEVAVAQRADLVVGLVDHSRVAQRFPHSKRTLLKFADGAMCGSNLFFLANPAALRVLRLWTELETLRKQPWRLAAGIGWGLCFRYLLGQLTAVDAFTALSRRCAARVSFCVLDEPRLAVDVDSVDDLQLAAELLRAEGQS